MFSKEFFPKHDERSGYGAGFGSPYEMPEFDIIAGENGNGDGFWYGYGHQSGDGEGEGSYFGYGDKEGGGFGNGVKFINLNEE